MSEGSPQPAVPLSGCSIVCAGCTLRQFCGGALVSCEETPMCSQLPVWVSVCGDGRRCAPIWASVLSSRELATMPLPYPHAHARRQGAAKAVVQRIASASQEDLPVFEDVHLSTSAKNFGERFARRTCAGASRRLTSTSCRALDLTDLHLPGLPKNTRRALSPLASRRKTLATPLRQARFL